jgi:hypothetical protein
VEEEDTTVIMFTIVITAEKYLAGIMVTYVPGIIMLLPTLLR